jgi:hypothetical protein
MLRRVAGSSIAVASIDLKGIILIAVTAAAPATLFGYLFVSEAITRRRLKRRQRNRVGEE